MKKVVLLLGLAFMLAPSCKKEQSYEPRLIEWAFDTEYTKASIADGGVFSWHSGDRIDVWNSTSGAFVPFTTIAGKGRFVATAPDNARFSGAAFYPSGIGGGTSYVTLPSSYSSPESSAAGFPMYSAVSEDDKVLHFKHLGAMLTITVTSVPAELTRLELRSSGTALSGRFDLATESGNKVIRQSSGSASALVYFSLPGDGTLSITLPVPVGTYPISICLGNDSNHEKLVVSSSGNLSFVRAHRYCLEAFDYLSEGFAINLASVENLSPEDDSTNWQ